MPSTWREAQSVIDDQVSRLQAEYEEAMTRLRKAFEEEKERLVSQRNSLSPIHCLPPELMVRIFRECIITSQAGEGKPGRDAFNPYARIQKITPDHSDRRDLSRRTSDYGFKSRQLGKVPNIIKLCHVSQHWRNLTLNTPELWNHVQVGQRTNADLLSFIRTNANNVPLDLDLDYDQLHSSPETSHIVSDMLCAGAGQLRSLAVCCDLSLLSAHPLSALEDVRPVADQLVSLELVSVRDAPSTPVLTPFASGTPNLRSVEIRGVQLPWTTGPLESPNLTHVALHSIPSFTTSTFSAFMAFLRRAKQLRCLHLDLPYQPSLTWGALGGRPPNGPYEPTNMDTIELVSKSAAPLLIIMESIGIDAGNMATVKVFCDQPVDHLRDICEFAGNVEDFFHMEIRCELSGTKRGFIITCDGEYTHFFEDRVVICPADQTFVTINTGTQFPFPPIGSSPYFRVPWSFNHLRCLAVGDMSGAAIHQSFWEELANLTTLEVVHLRPARIYIVLALYRSMVKSARKSTPPINGPTCTFLNKEASGKHTPEPVPHPYPALRALVFDSVGKAAPFCRRDVEILRYKLAPPWHEMGDLELYLHFAIYRLYPWRDYSGRPLDHFQLRRHSPSCNTCNTQSCCDDGGPELEPEQVGEMMMSSLGWLAKVVSLGDRHYDFRVPNVATDDKSTGTEGQGLTDL